MDTKLKRSRVVTYVIIKFIVLIGLFASVSMYIIGALNGYLTDSFMDTKQFEYTACALIENVYDLVVDTDTSEQVDSPYNQVDSYLAGSSDNGTFFYFVKKFKSDTIYQNSDCETLDEFKEKYFNDSEKYGMAITFFRGRGEAVKNGHRYTDDDWRLRYNLLGSYGGVDWRHDVEIGVAFASENQLQQMSEYGYGSVYDSYKAYYNGKNTMKLLPPIIIGFVSALIIMAAFSRYRTYMRQRIGSILIKVCIEIKLIVMLCIGGIIFNLLEWQYMFMYRMPFDATHAFDIALVMFWGYIELCDLLSNGLDIFKVNIFTTLIKCGRSIYRLLNSRKGEYSFRFIMKQRLFSIIKSVVAVAITVVVLFIFGSIMSSKEMLFIGVLMIIAGVIILSGMTVRFIKDYMQIVDDMDMIMNHMELIASGDTHTKLNIPGDNLLKPLAKNINSLQETMKTSLEQKIKSERMKVELITNVSHDLKTPLTSIINYTDLLLQEKLSPEYTNEYIAIINKKALRLNEMVKDLFDVAKANSGNIEINMQKLDLAEHIRQCIAEMDEQIATCSNEVRLSLPDEPVYINADGQKLYRVFENLLVNAIKYSLKNTRIYIMVQKYKDEVRLIMKNVSSYEMEFSGDDIVRRFVRGEQSRTSEGSGLGLAIAKSFIEVQNGKFDIDVDGDIFRVTIRFKEAKEDIPEQNPKQLETDKGGDGLEHSQS